MKISLKKYYASHCKIRNDQHVYVVVVVVLVVVPVVVVSVVVILVVEVGRVAPLAADLRFAHM
jgi:hypothetical protein